MGYKKAMAGIFLSSAFGAPFQVMQEEFFPDFIKKKKKAEQQGKFNFCTIFH